MSIKNHPNFHAVLFTTKIIEAVEASLRGAATGYIDKVLEDVDFRPELLDFVAKVEECVDACVIAQAFKKEE
jgi:hypothetical protein